MDNKKEQNNELIKPIPNDKVFEISPYIGGDGGDSKNKIIYKLSSNENILGPSKKAKEAFIKASENLELYPDGSAHKLREAIAKLYDINFDNIVCGAGSDEILSLIGQLFLTQGDEAIYSEHGFLMYPIIIKTNGATEIIAKEVDYKTSIDNILNAITEKTKIIFIANPNNPTGSYISYDEIKRLQKNMPPQILLVLDCAYAEFVNKNDYSNYFDLVDKYENIIVTRTFSKIYGLASLRLGWAYGPSHLIEHLNRIRGPFNVNAAALDAGLAAILDDEHTDKSRTLILDEIKYIEFKLNEIGYEFIPTVGNFILIHFDEKKNCQMEKAFNYLYEKGLILRKVKAYGFENSLRMTIATRKINDMVLAALQELKG